MNPGDYSPSVRARIWHLVRSASIWKKCSEARVWTELYDQFEQNTNVPWRKLAHNNGMTTIEAIQTKRRLESLLDLAREILVKPEVVVEEQVDA